MTWTKLYKDQMKNVNRMSTSSNEEYANKYSQLSVELRISDIESSYEFFNDYFSSLLQSLGKKHDRFIYMKNKILKARRWLKERPLFEKVIIHIGLFPLPVLFILISYSINNLNDN